MCTTDGILVDSCVTVDGRCAITWEIEGEQVQCLFGNPFSTGVTLALTQESLERLLETGTEVLRLIRTEEPEPVSAAAT